MAGVWWEWPRGLDNGLNLAVQVTFHNDPGLMQRGGLYLIGCTGFEIAGHGAYFGIQTDVGNPARPGGRYDQGRGAIFSRWYDFNEPRSVRLADTRTPDGGWTESGDYEGNFVSVRSNYPWRDGTYRMEIRGGELDDVGRWYEYWVVDGTGTETWIGSLRFPALGGIHTSCYTALEAYGGYLRPVDVPYWKVSVAPPVVDGVRAEPKHVCYPRDVENLRNALVAYDESHGTVVYEVGLSYLAHELTPDTVCP